MDQLSSCYFCGDALDASLEEHPVVPASLLPSADDQTTVVLCGTCKRKLDAVVDSVVAAVDSTSASAGDDVDGDRASNADSASQTDAPSDIESTLGDDEDVLRSVGSDERSADRSGGSSADPDGSDANRDNGDGRDTGDDPEEKPRKYTSSRRAGYTRHDSSNQWNITGGNDEPDESSSSGGDSDAEQSSDASSGGSDGGTSSSSSEQAADRSRGSGQGATSGGADASSGAGGSTSSGGSGGSGGSSDAGESGSDADTPEVSLTRLENTKVMRLLQNREFPVERQDFVAVASSAYEVSPDDCDKVIDLAVEHGLLREEGGQLYAGARWD